MLIWIDVEICPLPLTWHHSRYVSRDIGVCEENNWGAERNQSDFLHFARPINKQFPCEIPKSFSTGGFSIIIAIISILILNYISLELNRLYIFLIFDHYLNLNISCIFDYYLTYFGPLPPPPHASYAYVERANAISRDNSPHITPLKELADSKQGGKYYARP